MSPASGPRSKAAQGRAQGRAQVNRAHSKVTHAKATDRTVTLRKRRQARVRKKVVGTTERPRLAVFRSNRHMVAQVIDDSVGRTIAAASTNEGPLRSAGTGNVAAAAAVGRAVGERAIAAGVTKVTFDRGGFRYHGRVAAVADAARESGLEL